MHLLLKEFIYAVFVDNNAVNRFIGLSPLENRKKLPLFPMCPKNGKITFI